MKTGTEIAVFLPLGWGSLALMWFSCKANSDLGLGIGVAIFAISQLLFVHLVYKLKPIVPYIDARDSAREVRRDEN